MHKDRSKTGLVDGNDSSSRTLTWVLFAGCWGAYGATLVLGGIPFGSEPDMLFMRAMFLADTVLCSWPLWVFCRFLWRRNWSWPWAMLAAATLCYPLGCSCALFPNVLQKLWSHTPAPWSAILLTAFSATSPFCILIFWCGLYFGLQQYERHSRVEALARQAELSTLRHQLTPHFLCNTLNGISTLVGEGRTQEARRMIARLGDFLRATLDSSGALEVSLEQEISYLEQYLAIEQARLGERLSVEMIIAPEVLDASVPNLLLQPLVENALQHGVLPFPAGGDVTIRAERRQARVWVTVCNRCRSPVDAPFAAGVPPPASGLPGLGLSNTARRLDVAYGAAARVACQQEDARSWTATVELPYHAWSNPGTETRT